MGRGIRSVCGSGLTLDYICHMHGIFTYIYYSVQRALSLWQYKTLYSCHKGNIWYSLATTNSVVWWGLHTSSSGMLATSGTLIDGGEDGDKWGGDGLGRRAGKVAAAPSLTWSANLGSCELLPAQVWTDLASPMHSYYGIAQEGLQKIYFLQKVYYVFWVTFQGRQAKLVYCTTLLKEYEMLPDPLNLAYWGID